MAVQIARQRNDLACENDENIAKTHPISVELYGYEYAAEVVDSRSRGSTGAALEMKAEADAEDNDSASGITGAAAHIECGNAPEVPVCNPCADIEFPARVDELFRSGYGRWSEQQTIEFAASEYLRNVILIVTEAGLHLKRADPDG
jgi:hypothetical protein